MDIINRLPIDIVMHIIPYTYNLQSSRLLFDIVNYKEKKATLHKLYYNFWIIIQQDVEPEDKNWLINDIFLYANDNKASMYGYVDNFYNIFKRCISLKTKEEIDKYVYHLEKKDVNTQINIFLGLLTPEERLDVVTLFQSANV
jgi:hypothetical protein